MLLDPDYHAVMIAWQTRPDRPSCLSGMQCDDVTLSPFGYGKNVIGPTFERTPLIAIVGRLVVNAGDTGLMADVTEDTLDDVRRDTKSIVHDGRGGTAKIVQHPSRHRLGNAGDLAGGRDALVERPLRRRPGDKSRSPATEDKIATVARWAGGQNGERGGGERNRVWLAALSARGRQPDLGCFDVYLAPQQVADLGPARGGEHQQANNIAVPAPSSASQISRSSLSLRTRVRAPRSCGLLVKPTGFTSTRPSPANQVK